MKLKSGSNSGLTGGASRQLRIFLSAACVISLLPPLLAFGCAATRDEQARTPTRTPAETPTPIPEVAEAPTATAELSAPGQIDSITARPWSREGLDEQPRMAALQQRTPADLGYSPGTTIWRAADVDLPSTQLADAAVGNATSPGALLEDLAAALPAAGELGVDVWEQTLRIWQGEDDEAVGVVLRWGMKDDSVIGHDHRVHMQRSGDRWRVDRLEERFHCSRGVTDDGLCV